MSLYAYALIAAGTLLWAAPFPLFRSVQKGLLVLDRNARWGVVLQCLGYSLLWQGSFWTRSTAHWQILLSTCLFALADLLSWMSARALGRQLRLDAALDSAHQLIRRGPYGIVRHPIYTSMLCVFMATGLLTAPFSLFLPGLLFFQAGSEIRMRIEDRLLAERFGEDFQTYRRHVPRFIPFLN